MVVLHGRRGSWEVDSSSSKQKNWGGGGRGGALYTLPKKVVYRFLFKTGRMTKESLAIVHTGN